MTPTDPSTRSSRQVVRIFRLGEEPREDLLATTTAEERLDILRELTARAWALSGKPILVYSRDWMPVRITRLR
jgi:hypothetical protein